MDSILVNTESRQYPVYLGNNVIEKLTPFIKINYQSATKVFIITDETVGKLHLPALMDQLKELQPAFFQVPSGEQAKSFPVYYEAMTAALEAGLDRNSLLLAFGGGAVGDVGGFVAATFMRGIPFIQIPTTILAHDSAVGGKVAINHHLGKNLIGAFYQPEAVFYDLNFLDTLPIGEKRSGFAEVIKHALIQDADFYNWLIKNVTNLEYLTKNQLSYCLEKGINIKARIVSIDERENGIRAYLNFGHTLGHAIESEIGYGEITHGEAVMIGMGFALRMSKELLNLN
ncbi:MAG: 3-dehydroquinate synthase, partial [Bacillota bacterium]|nr:3-dehydroquinate synthase [Bacillota bacterium]